MAQKIYDLAVKTGEYTDREGNQKGRWQNVGVVLQHDDGGKQLLLSKWFNPAGVPDLNGKGGEMVSISMFEPRQNDSGYQQQQPAQPRQPMQTQPAQNYQQNAPMGDVPF